MGPGRCQVAECQLKPGAAGRPLATAPVWAPVSVTVSVPVSVPVSVTVSVSVPV